MILFCKKNHPIPESMQLLAGACKHPDCVCYERFNLEGKLIDWPPELRDAELEKARQRGIEEGMRLYAAKHLQLTGEALPELINE